MAEKIHCDLLELYGPNWAELGIEKSVCFAESIHSAPQMFGSEPHLFGFVGTRLIGSDIVGGYFAIQYENEEFNYTRNKKLSIETHAPFERLFFIVFARTGKVLLQNTKFSGIPLNMPKATGLFKQAIDHILLSCQITKTYNIDLAPDETTDADFVKEFEKSSRVVKVEIKYPDGESIPEDFVYYNPQKDRNSIIRDSHIHDYPKLKRIDLEATEDGDIKNTHLRDLIYVGRPQLMRYFIDFEEFTLRKTAKRKFEIHVDMEAEQIPEEHVVSTIEMLRRERAVYIDRPTPLPTRKPNDDSQLTIFDLYNDDENDNGKD
jgi:hypothetical protein